MFLIAPDFSNSGLFFSIHRVLLSQIYPVLRGNASEERKKR
jgi:hypothetical protein